ncbi:MAG: hypothetical protein H0U56_15695 [Methylibium sp.]|nr:hypothetical protein [Methylibium sp.]
MSEVLVASDAVPANVQHPLDTELASAATFKSLFSQPLLNWVNYLDRRLRLLGTTETRTPADDISEFSDIVLPSSALLGPSNAFREVATKLGNRTKFLNDAVTAVKAGIAGVAPSYALNVALNAAVFNSGPRFTGGVTGWTQTSVTDAGALSFRLALPDLGRITAVTAIVDGGSAHAGLPLTLPTLTLSRVDHVIGAASNAATSVAVVADSSPTVADYQLLHTISATGLSLTLDATKSWYVQFTGEADANSMASQLKLIKLSVTLAP